MTCKGSVKGVEMAPKECVHGADNPSPLAKYF